MSQSNTLIDRENFVKTQLKLIHIEYSNELEKTQNKQKDLKIDDLIRQGDCIQNLRCLSTEIGLFDRLLITLGHNQIDKQLPAHKITCGDMVSIYKDVELRSLASGVVYALNSNDITVVFEKDSYLNLDEQFTNYCLIKLWNNVNFRRLKKALYKLRDYPVGGRAWTLIDLLIGCRLPRRILYEIEPIDFINRRLDDSQREAVTFALRSRDLCIIHGPPGTGKTTSIVEVILQHVKRGHRVLVCAPSNVAVDNLIERLALYKAQNMVRLGHPARASKKVLKFTLDAAIARNDKNDAVKKIRQDVAILRRSRDRDKRAQITEMMIDLVKHEKSLFNEILSSCDIILATLVSSSNEGALKHLTNLDQYFDVLIIDECSQSLETACWIPLTFVDKCILSGDHFQLPPTVFSQTAAKNGLEISLMERLLSRFDHEKLVRMLTVQYRMHQKIMEWSSKSFYSNKLTAHHSVKNQSMAEISRLTDCPPLLLIDTAGCDMPELILSVDESKGNKYEADIAASYVTHLITAGVKPEQIGVITPYSLQVELIKLRLSRKYPDVEIRSVDGFQGREKEVIILSLVRSNAKKATGFLREYRRINVAVTRAKKHLVVICDSDTVTAEKHIASLVDYLNENGEVRSARSYLKSNKNPKISTIKETTINNNENIEKIVADQLSKLKL